MIVINIVVDGVIKPFSVYDTNNKLTQSIVAGLKIPTGNYNDVLLNFEFVSPKPKEGLYLFGVFKSPTSKKIEMEIGKFEYEGETFENSCFIPHEVLNAEGKVELGVYGYKLNGEELEKRISLIPVEFTVVKGSYDAEASESVLPTSSVFEFYFDRIKKATDEIEDNLKNTMITYKKLETVYTTTEDAETEIPIDIEEYVEDEGMLFVKINGLDLIEKTEYTVADKKITLVKAVDKDTPIHIVYLKPMKEDVKNLGYKIEELEEELETLYGDFEPNKASGEIATINDGVDKSRVEVQGDGNSYQETRVGYNILNLFSKRQAGYTRTSLGITYTLNADGSVTISGTSTADNSYIDLYYDESVVLGNLGENITFALMNKTGNFEFMCHCYDWQGGWQNNSSGKNIVIHDVNANSTGTIIRILVEKAGSVINETVYPMVVNGSYTFDTIPPFEQYGSKPSTEYSSDIEVIDMVNQLNVKELSSIATQSGIKVDNDDYITAGSTDNRDWTYSKANWFKTLKKGIYTFVVLTKQAGTSSNIGLAINTDADKRLVSMGANNLVNAISLQTFTLQEETNIGIFFKVYDGIYRIMLLKGEYTKDTLPPYLPYGCIGLSQRGKNAFNINDLIQKGVLDQPVVKGIRLYLKPNTSYTVSTNMVSDNSSTNKVVPKIGEPENTSAFVFVTTDKTITSFTSANNGVGITTHKRRTFVTDETGYLYVGCRNQFFDMLNDLIAQGGFIQVEEGTVATEPEEYKDNLIPIDLQGNTLAKVGDIKDLLNIGLDGSVSDKKTTDRYIFTGEESSLIENYVTKGLFQITLDNVTIDLDTPRAKSNYLKGTAGKYITQTGVNNCVSTYNGNRIFIRIDEFANNLDGFKNWLKEKYTNGTPLYVDYVLAKSNTIQLPSIKPIKLFEGTNNFELVTNLDTTLAVSYRKSNKKRLAKIEALLESGV